MIKTYRARVNCNNVSYLLYGKQGNQVRFNFTNGNVVTNKYPSLTLRGRYYQELLEDSEMFKAQTVVLEHKQEEYSGEEAALEAEKNSCTTMAAASTEQTTQKVVQTEVVKGLKTSDEIIAYINERYGKDCKTLATALKHANKDGLVFPDFNE